MGLGVSMKSFRDVMGEFQKIAFDCSPSDKPMLLFRELFMNLRVYFQKDNFLKNLIRDRHIRNWPMVGLSLIHISEPTRPY